MIYYPTDREIYNQSHEHDIPLPCLLAGQDR